MLGLCWTESQCFLIHSTWVTRAAGRYTAAIKLCLYGSSDIPMQHYYSTAEAALNMLVIEDNHLMISQGDHIYVSIHLPCNVAIFTLTW